MKRPVAAAIAAVVFALVLLAQAPSLTAFVTPAATPNGISAISPLSTPATRYDPYYRANPRTITPHSVPYVNQAGETIVQEFIYQEPHRDPLVVSVKAQPVQQAAPLQTPLTFQSPVGGLPYQVYVPLVSKPGNAKVLAIVYKGEPAWVDPDWLVSQQIDHINRGTSFHGVGETSIGFELAGRAVNIVNSYPPTSTTYWGYINLNAVYQQFNICNRVISEGINEVWIYVDGKPGGHIYSGGEWLENGPAWSILWGVPIDPPNCGKQVFTMLYNFDRYDDVELEAWVHSAEWSFLYARSSGTQNCDFQHPGNYGDWPSETDYDQACRYIPYSDVSGFMILPGSVNGNISVCGDAHFPPNTPSNLAHPGPDEYVYDRPDTVLSRCTDWQWNILTNTVPVSGATWGNTEVGFLQWWMQNVPGKGNNLHGRDGSLRPNWWDFRLKR